MDIQPNDYDSRRFTLAAQAFDTVEHTLAAFIDAFNDLDRARVEACFAEDVTVFYPWGGERSSAFWTHRFDTERKQQAGPPYQDLQPVDAKIQRFDGIAVVTFLFRRAESLGRRTLVLHRSESGWKIVHLHASNYPDDVGNTSQAGGADTADSH